MGNFEKLVVVVVLFLSAVVLAVSLRGGDEENDPKNPLEAAGVTPAPGVVNPLDADANAPATPESSTTGFLLDAGASRGATSAPTTTSSSAPSSAMVEKPSAVPAAAPTSSPRILVGTEGLVPSALDDFMVYTPADGDTWAALAQRFYGNAAYLSNLREANEGMGDALDPTVPILVPVYDFHAGAGAAGTAKSDLAAAPAADTGATGRTAGSTPASGASVYEVEDGDNLSKISKKVYGTTTRWADIYEANRDKLESPDKLVVGMKLAIPAGSSTGGSTTLAAHKPAEVARTSTSKPTAAQPKPAEKKRKVQ
jgi:nucleoid-associated protein YgaU